MLDRMALGQVALGEISHDSVTIDMVMVADALSLLNRDSVWPIGTVSTVQLKDTSCCLEFVAGIERHSHLTTGFTATISSDISLPDEISTGIRPGDVPVQLEFIGEYLFSSDVVLQLESNLGQVIDDSFQEEINVTLSRHFHIMTEFVAGTFVDAAFPLSIESRLAFDAALPGEILGGTATDTPTLADTFASLVRDHAFQAEWFGSVRRDSAWQIEFDVFVEGVSAGSVVPLESMSLLRRDDAFLMELYGSVVASDAAAQLEQLYPLAWRVMYGQGVQFGFAALGQVQLGGAYVSQTTASTAPALMANAEFVGNFSRDAAANFEFIAPLLTRESSIATEFLRSHADDSPVAAEWLGTHAITGDAGLPMEFESTVEGITAGSPTPLEFSSTFLRDSVGQVEFGINVSRDDLAQSEVLYPLAWRLIPGKGIQFGFAALGQVELGGEFVPNVYLSTAPGIMANVEVISGFSRDAVVVVDVISPLLVSDQLLTLESIHALTVQIRVNAEWTDNFVGDTKVPAEWINSILSWDVRLPFESVSRVVSDRAVTLDVLFPFISVDARLNLDTTANFLTDSVVNVSVSGSFNSLGGPVMPLEFLVSSRIDEIVLFGISLQLLPGRIVASVRRRVRVVYNHMFRADQDQE